MNLNTHFHETLRASVLPILQRGAELDHSAVQMRHDAVFFGLDFIEDPLRTKEDYDALMAVGEAFIDGYISAVLVMRGEE